MDNIKEETLGGDTPKMKNRESILQCDKLSISSENFSRERIQVKEVQNFAQRKIHTQCRYAIYY